jgi:hypothetical protein
MAHRIFEYDRQQGKEQAWHGKTVITPDLTLDNNWLREWDLVPRKIADLENNEELPWVYLRCSDNSVIRVGQPYNPATFQPVNNADFLDMIKASISGTPHTVSSVGSLRNRGRVFVSIELMGMEKFKAAGRDFGAFLNFGNGHDKSSVLWVNTSNICTVCDNTFSCNLVSVENKVTMTDDDNVRISQRHTKNVKLRLPDIASMVDKAIGVQAEFKLEMDKLAAIAVSRNGVTQLFAGFIGRNVSDKAKGLSTRAVNTVAKLDDLFVNGRGNRGETLADAFSATTDFYTHFSSGGENVMRQMVSSDYGSGQANKAEFWNLVRNGELRETTRARGEELLVNTAKD